MNQETTHSWLDQFPHGCEVAADDGKAARHRLDRLERGHQTAYAVVGAWQRKDVQRGVVIAHLGVRHPTGEQGYAAVEAQSGGKSLQRWAFRTVAHDQQS